MNHNQLKVDTEPSTVCSANVIVAGASALWDTYKEQGLSFLDILEVCACLMANVADKSESTDAEIIATTANLVKAMRGEPNAQAVPNGEQAAPPTR